MTADDSAVFYLINTFLSQKTSIDYYCLSTIVFTNVTILMGTDMNDEADITIVYKGEQLCQL